MFRSCQIIIRELCFLLKLYYGIHNSILICKRGVVAAYHVVWECVVEQWLGVRINGEFMPTKWHCGRFYSENLRFPLSVMPSTTHDVIFSNSLCIIMERCKTGNNIAFRLEDTAIGHHVVTILLSIQSRQPSSWSVDWMMKTSRPSPSLKFIPSDCFVGLSQTESLLIKQFTKGNKKQRYFCFCFLQNCLQKWNPNLMITHDL